MSFIKQFANAYVRQIARNTANDNYYSNTTTESINDTMSQWTLEVPTYKTYILWVVLNCIPIVAFFAQITMFVKGVKRFFSKNVRYGYYIDQAVYQTDRRYRDGKKYIGTERVKETIEMPKTKKGGNAHISHVEDTNRYNKHALIYIVVGLLTFLMVWPLMWVMH